MPRFSAFGLCRFAASMLRPEIRTLDLGKIMESEPGWGGKLIAFTKLTSLDAWLLSSIFFRGQCRGRTRDSGLKRDNGDASAAVGDVWLGHPASASDLIKRGRKQLESNRATSRRVAIIDHIDRRHRKMSRV
jgi:hypothetical protein